MADAYCAGRSTTIRQAPLDPYFLTHSPSPGCPVFVSVLIVLFFATLLIFFFFFFFARSPSTPSRSSSY